MKKNNLAVAKTPTVEPSEFIGKSGYYLRIIDGCEGNSDFDSVTIENGICAEVSDSGLYCITPDGQKVTWFESFYSALQQAYAIADFWEDYDFEKPLVFSLSDEMHEKLFSLDQWYKIKEKNYKDKLEESLKCIIDAAHVWFDEGGGIPPAHALFDLLQMFVENQKNNGYESVKDIFVDYEMYMTPRKSTEEMYKDVINVNNKDAFEKLMKTL